MVNLVFIKGLDIVFGLVVKFLYMKFVIWISWGFKF